MIFTGIPEPLKIHGNRSPTLTYQILALWTRLFNSYTFIRVVSILKIFINQTGHLTKGVYGQNMLPYQIWAF